jgi:hypothetical protein
MSLFSFGWFSAGAVFFISPTAALTDGVGSDDAWNAVEGRLRAGTPAEGRRTFYRFFYHLT